VVLLRTIQQLGLPNLGINLDPANLLMYGKGNPIDALDMIGPYVRNIHVKDGEYPTDGERLGREVPVGQGRVDFPRFVATLQERGFTGEWIIEREISGEQQLKDIQQTIADLRRWGKD
jgi:L-ribulose-5-phosphate 3-epimerase